jgi:drug/metabolite transporter (DMT)-like permease
VSRKGWLLFCALCVIWGIPYLLIRVAVRELSPPALVFFRTAPATLLLMPFALRRGELRKLLARWRWVCAFTLAELAIPWLLLSHAEQQLTSSLAGLLIASVPLIGAVLYRIAGTGDHVDRRRLAGLVVGFVGVAALVGIDVSGGHPRAVAEVIVVAICYATGPLIISRRLSDLPGIGVTTMSLAITAVVYATPAMLDLPSSVSGETIAAVATLAVVCTALAFLFFFALILEVGPARSTVITYINPVVAVLLGVILLGEPFTAGIAIGLPLIIAGSILATAPPLRRGLTGPAAGPPAP